MESYRNQLNRFNKQLKSFTKIPKGDLLEWQKTRINKIKENIERIEGLIKAAKRKSPAKTGATTKRKSPAKTGAPAKKFHLLSPSEKTLNYIRTVLEGDLNGMDKFINWTFRFKENDIVHAIKKYKKLSPKQKEDINIFIKKTFKKKWHHSTDDGGMIFYNTSSDTLHETLAHKYLK